MNNKIFKTIMMTVATIGLSASLTFTSFAANDATEIVDVEVEDEEIIEPETTEDDETTEYEEEVTEDVVDDTIAPDVNRTIYESGVSFDVSEVSVIDGHGTLNVSVYCDDLDLSTINISFANATYADKHINATVNVEANESGVYNVPVSFNNVKNGTWTLYFLQLIDTNGNRMTCTCDAQVEVINYVSAVTEPEDEEVDDSEDEEVLPVLPVEPDYDTTAPTIDVIYSNKLLTAYPRTTNINICGEESESSSVSISIRLAKVDGTYKDAMYVNFSAEVEEGYYAMTEEFTFDKAYSEGTYYISWIKVTDSEGNPYEVFYTLDNSVAVWNVPVYEEPIIEVPEDDEIIDDEPAIEEVPEDEVIDDPIIDDVVPEDDEPVVEEVPEDDEVIDNPIIDDVVPEDDEIIDDEPVIEEVPEDDEVIEEPVVEVPEDIVIPDEVIDDVVPEDVTPDEVIEEPVVDNDPVEVPNNVVPENNEVIEEVPEDNVVIDVVIPDGKVIGEDKDNNDNIFIIIVDGIAKLFDAISGLFIDMFE